VSDILSKIAIELMGPAAQQQIQQYNPYLQMAPIPMAVAQGFQQAPYEDRSQFKKNMLVAALGGLGSGLLQGYGQNYQSELTDRYNKVLLEGMGGGQPQLEGSGLRSGLFGQANQGAQLFRQLEGIQSADRNDALNRQAQMFLFQGAMNPEYPRRNRQEFAEALQGLTGGGIPSQDVPQQGTPMRIPSAEEDVGNLPIPPQQPVSGPLGQMLEQVRDADAGEVRPQMVETPWGEMFGDSTFAVEPPSENDVINPGELTSFPMELLEDLPDGLVDQIGFRNARSLMSKAYDYEHRLNQKYGDWWNNVPALERRQLVGAFTAISAMEQVTGMLDEVQASVKGERAPGWARWQGMSRLDPSSLEFRTRQMMKYYTPMIARAQGHVGNLNQREVKVAKEVLEGSLLSSPGDQAEMLREVRRQLLANTQLRLEAWQRASSSRTGGDALKSLFEEMEEKLRKEQNVPRGYETIERLVRRKVGAQPPHAEIVKQLRAKGVTDEQLIERGLIQ
jgi:hypothetical protein